MTEAKDALRIARESCSSFFPDAAGIHLEEIELDRGKKNWMVTLSFDVNPSTPSEILSIKKTRVFKIFHVDAKSGDLLGMKNWETNPLNTSK